MTRVPRAALTLSLAAAAGGFLLYAPTLHAPERGPDAPGEQEARTLFVGDMFFDRSIRTTAEVEGYDYLLSCVKDRFLSYDAVIANLEGPITTKRSVAAGSKVGSWQNYTFTFEPEVAALLARHNVKAVSLGNNHIGNMGEEGIAATQRYLESAGISYFGGVQDKSASDKNTMIYHSVLREPIWRSEIGGQRLSFVAYNQFGGMPPEAVASRIKAEKAGGRFVVVFAHWGEEYVPPVKAVREQAALFARAGAGLIIGSHPHIVQESEVLGQTKVYYSLGNFLFDQFFSEDVRHGLAVEATFKDGRLIDTKELPTTMLQDERRVCFDADLPGA